MMVVMDAMPLIVAASYRLVVYALPAVTGSVVSIPRLGISIISLDGGPVDGPCAHVPMYKYLVVGP